MTLSFRFLGTASGLPEVDRFGQTTVMTNTNADGTIEHVLLDVGDGAASLLRKYDYDFLAIKTIAICHMHGDHHAGFIQVVKTMMHLQRHDDLVVLAPEEGLEGLEHYLRMSYLIEELLGFRIVWVPLIDSPQTTIPVSSNVTLSAFQNAHLRWTRERFVDRSDLPRAYTYESYSFVLTHPDHRVVFSGNLDGPQGANELAPHLDPCDLLICELAHVDPGALGELLTGHDVKRVAVAHFHPKWNGKERRELVELMEQRAPGISQSIDVLFARDGDEVVL